MDERDRAESRRLSRRRAGAHRQCRRRAGAARHLWQHHPRRHADVLRPPAAAAGRRVAVPAARSARAQGRTARARRPTPASGNIAAASASTRIRSRCAGPAATGSPRSRSALGFVERAQLLERRRRPHSCGAAGEGLEREARTPSPPPSAPTTSMPACCCCPNSAWSRPNDPRFVSTVAAIERELLRGKHVMRYASPDDFGMPEGGIPDLPLLADRCLVVARPQAGGARPVRRRAANTAIATGLLAEDIHLQTGSSGAIFRRPIRWRG